ncbi:DUF4129 domain-containing protein [Catalinimonas niigatensis]|uniref:DUF4129 domain-containing protein n=1 Tax=Catalinimonas niigatensis TaxID=1397264 RepID=UPI0026654BDB|nr:DUF4129 domain-containing protein [Catalinimonas niigatensis]WPP48098.1 DUF4129 domain-containing protein [Catalinimonas niigatensis]
MLVILISSYVSAQERVPDQVYYFNDSLRQEVEGLSIPPEIIEQYHADEDFDYRYGYQQTISLWDQFWGWILQQLSKLFGEVNFSFPINWLLYIFCAAIISFAVLRLTGVSISGIFNRQDQRSGMDVQDILDEDIHALNFEEEISKAQQAQDYRRAIRLLYIYTLKKLTDHDLIQWHQGKTNADYQRELQESDLQQDFRSLSIYYEYAWYGEFPVDTALYEKVNALHQSIDRQLAVSA